jgi:hypothetical protein
MGKTIHKESAMVPVKYIFLLPVAVFLTFLISCQEKVFTGDVNCEECFVEKPDSVDLMLHLTINNDTIPVLLFEGTIDKGQLIDTFFCNSNISYIWVKAEREYAAKAIYKMAKKTIYVVDGKKQKLKRVSSTCDETCWLIEDIDMYLELK